MQSFDGKFYSWEVLYVHFSFYSYVSTRGPYSKFPGEIPGPGPPITLKTDIYIFICNLQYP